MPVIAVNDIEMYYESHGAGAPLLLLPGAGQPLTDLRPLVYELARSWRVIVVDNRGAGRSSAPRGPYTIEQMADDTRAMLDHLDVEKAHVVGISMGGRIALHLTLEHPQRVNRLVLISTGARVGGPRWRIRLGVVLARLPIVGSPSPQPFHAMMAQFEASTRYDCTSRLAEIGQPALILQGRTDPLALPALAEQLHAGLRDAQLILFDAGHRLVLTPEFRALVVKTIEAFLTADVGQAP
jgi:pimeloyl-ACP methyl ester carboxylesterase